MSEPEKIVEPAQAEETSAAEVRISSLVAEYEQDRRGGAGAANEAEQGQAGEGQPGPEGMGAQPEEVSPQDAVLGTIQLAGAMADHFGYKNVNSVLQDARWSVVSEKSVPVLQKTAFGRRILAFLQAGLGFDEIQLFLAISPLWGVLKTAFQNDVVELRKKAEEAKKPEAA